jgi:hypothetical protein
VQADDAKAVMLPTGWLYIMVFPQDTIGLRWTANADTADDNRVKIMLGHLLKAYPNLRNGSAGYQQFLDLLEAG